MAANNSLLEVAGLTVRVLDSATAQRRVLLSQVDLTLPSEQTTGVTGESGGGKSVLALTLAGLTPPSAVISATRWRLFNTDLMGGQPSLTGAELTRRVRLHYGANLFHISQDARSALVPYRRLAWHLQCVSKTQPASTAQLLEQLHLRPPAEFLGRLPQELSTGQCQRIQLALAVTLAQCAIAQRQPFLLLADEPLASVEGGLVHGFGDRLQELVASGGTLLIVSHQLQLLRRITKHLVIVHDGKIAEQGSTATLLDPANSSGKATQRLLAIERCTTYERPQPYPNLAAQHNAQPSAPLIATSGVSKQVGRRWMHFPDLAVQAGERVGLLGPSGCGKTTFARVLLGLTPCERGVIKRFDNPRWNNPLAINQRPALWERLQFTPQDADVLFDPQGLLGDSIAATVQAYSPHLSYQATWQTTGEMLQRFQLPTRLLLNAPGRLSGGQRKRAALVRSLAALGWLQSQTNELPRLLVLDEPTVGLDLYLQAVLADILLEAQSEANLAYLVISHDHRFVDRFCQRQIVFPSS